MTRYAFPSRQAVEREIESVENPRGMRLNDGMERPRLPGGTLRYMLAVIDRLNAAKDAAYAAGQRAERERVESLQAEESPFHQVLCMGEGCKECERCERVAAAIRNRKEQG